MSALGHLKPTSLWINFEEICRIPRISKHEDKIGKYLLHFAKKNQLESRIDETGNILIVKPASKGFENRKTVVLQSHLDMVGEKNAANPHNWETDAITPVTDGEWVSATGTTLGADDGIGIAAQMAILVDSALKAGKIECLFTVDEETGMTGAINLKPDFFEGRILLNLDSEDEGILFIGCAGGMDTVGVMNYTSVASLSTDAVVRISLTGLRGGHSGDEIHKGFGNSVKLLGRLLSEISAEYRIAISDFEAGNLRNAIPREGFSTIIVDKKDKDSIIAMVNRFFIQVKNEIGTIENNIKITCEDVLMPQSAMDGRSMKLFLDLLSSCPHGVLAWSKEMDDLVETSTNLASAKFNGNNTVTIVTSQRSSVEASKHKASGLVAECLTKAGASVESSGGYPGWQPDIKSEILEITSNSYLRLFGKEPVVRSIHAGLECGMFFEKFAGIDMISFGPTIRGAHTPEEKIEISTVTMFWELLTDVIANIPE